MLANLNRLCDVRLKRKLLAWVAPTNAATYAALPLSQQFTMSERVPNILKACSTICEIPRLSKLVYLLLALIELIINLRWSHSYFILNHVGSFLPEKILLIILPLCNNQRIILDVISLILIGEHLIEEFLDSITILTLVSIIVLFVLIYRISFTIFPILAIQIFTAMVPFISFAKFVYLFQCFGLLVLLGV